MAAPTLANFRAELGKRNVARANQFYIQLMPPPGLNKDTANLNLISMWCHGANTPQAMIATMDQYHEAGAMRKFAHDSDASNLLLHFYSDQAYVIKEFFDKWIKLVNPNNKRFTYSDDYTSDRITVTCVDQTSKDTYTYTYCNVYPKTISSIDLNHQPASSPVVFTVEFVYEYWKADKGDSTKITDGEITQTESLALLEQIIAANDTALSYFY
jgi:hypothetical protein